MQNRTENWRYVTIAIIKLFKHASIRGQDVKTAGEMLIFLVRNAFYLLFLCDFFLYTKFYYFNFINMQYMKIIPEKWYYSVFRIENEVSLNEGSSWKRSLYSSFTGQYKGILLYHNLWQKITCDAFYWCKLYLKHNEWYASLRWPTTCFLKINSEWRL